MKDNNKFLRKGLNGVTFSSEKGNLYNINTFKHSGETPAASDAGKSRLGHPSA